MIRTLLFWLLLIISVVGGAYLAIKHFGSAPSALKQIVSPGSLSPRHAFLENQCASCHETGVGVTAAKCAVCHANSERLLGRQPSAFHATIQECAACHVEHQGANVRPVGMDHVEFAKINARTLARASKLDPASDATFKALQALLRIPNPRQINEHSATAALNCAGCHSTKDRHLGLFGKDCAQCHTTIKWTISDYKHPSPSSRDCSQCHQAPPSHYMMHFNMISKKVAGQEDAKVSGCCGPAQVNQCYRCHQTTNWNDIIGVGYYKHH